MTRRLAVAACLSLFLVSACRKEAAPSGAGIAPEGVPPQARSLPPASPASASDMAQAKVVSLGGAPTQPPSSDLSTVPVPSERKLIRNATATLQVRSLDDALAALRALAEKAGGYSTDESKSRDEHGVGRGTLTCRIPAGKLNSVTEALKSIGTIEDIRISANDITEEYFDLEIRLRNQRQLETRLLALLNRPDNKLSDLLEAEREIARVRGEIDQMEGRKRLWDNQVALSTVTVGVHEPAPAVASAEGGAWPALKRSFSEAADNFVLSIAAIIAISGGLIPVLVALSVVFWLVRTAWRARRARKPVAAGRT